MITLAEKHTKEFLGLRNSLERDGGVDFYNLDYPSLYELRDGEWVEHIHSCGDIYILIREYALSASRLEETNITALALVTCGWASRLPEGHDSWDDDANIPRPSEADDRMRCAMVYGIARDGSTYSHVDIDGAKSSGEAYGRGALLDACEYLGLGVWKREWAFGVLSWYGQLHSEAVAAGDVIDSDVVKWFAHRLAMIQEMLGHDFTDDTDSPDDLLP